MRCSVLVTTLICVAVLFACGEPLDGEPFDRGEGSSESRVDYFERYPDAPYGNSVGAVIEDMDFLGWHNASAEGFDSARVRRISLREFHDPDGSLGIKLIMINVAASWCAACQIEYERFDEDGSYAYYRERGVEFVGTLYEGPAGAPASFEDLEHWGETFEVAFPFVLDPGFQMGSYFNRAATPMNMLVDAKTMHILRIEEGWSVEEDSSYWNLVEYELSLRQ